MKTELIELLETFKRDNNGSSFEADEILSLFYKLKKDGKLICFSCGSLNCEPKDDGIFCNDCLDWIKQHTPQQTSVEPMTPEDLRKQFEDETGFDYNQYIVFLETHGSKDNKTLAYINWLESKQTHPQPIVSDDAADTLTELRRVNERRSIEGFKMELMDWSLPEWGNAVAGEVGEMCNIIKKFHRGDFDTDPEKGLVKLQKEMADIIIYIDLVAAREKIDLREAIISKFNEVSDRVNCDIKMKAQPQKPEGRECETLRKGDVKMLIRNLREQSEHTKPTQEGDGL